MLQENIYLEKLLAWGRKIIPKRIFEFLQPRYHWTMAWSAALFYRFPSRKMKVIGVTGTKGKSTVVYLASKIFEEAEFTVAAIGSLGYKIGAKEWPNILGNTMPGRFRLQKFLWEAKKAGTKYVILEVTSACNNNSIHHKHSLTWCRNTREFITFIIIFCRRILRVTHTSLIV